MSEELEALKFIFDEALFSEFKNETSNKVRECYSIVCEALQRLNAIENSNPSEALVKFKDNTEMFEEIALKDSHSYKDDTVIEAYVYHSNNIVIEQALIKAQEQEKENARYKQALKVIFEKGFDRTIKDYKDYDIWLEEKIEQFAKSIEKNPTILNWDMFDKFTYTKDEFALLKEMI